MYAKVDHVESLRKMEYRLQYEDLTHEEKTRLEIVIRVYKRLHGKKLRS